MRNLHLDRPLVCFDLETTGTDIATDRIVQIGLIRVETDGSCRSFEALMNPQRPIPQQATAVHGITDADVAGKPTFPQLADEILRFFEGADVAGYNSLSFDLPLLLEELARAGHPLDMSGRRHVDAMRIFHKMEPRNLTAALRFYCDKELEGAHSALADASAALEVLDAQVARYQDLPDDTEGLDRYCSEGDDRFVDATHKFAWNEQGEAAFVFGKYKGRTLRDVARTNAGYLDWILEQNFTIEVKQITRDAQRGIFPRKE
jgi:DNA polymerase-3 subunit epsilon